MAAWNDIIKLAEKSGIPFRVVSTTRPGDPLYHGRGWAVDFGGYNQDELASYFMKFQSREIIHRSQKTGKLYFTSNNKPNSMAGNEDLFRGPSSHENHLHVAMDEDQTRAALAGGGFANVSDSDSVGLNPFSWLLEPLRAAQAFFNALTDASTWKRVGFVLVGLALLMIAWYYVSGKTVKPLINDVTKVVT